MNKKDMDLGHGYSLKLYVLYEANWCVYAHVRALECTEVSFQVHPQTGQKQSPMTLFNDVCT